MDTRPEHRKLAQTQYFCDKSIVVEPNTPCPRQSHPAARRGGDTESFVEASKCDDGDAVRIAEER
jgi:hypothetical protein